MNGKSWTTDIMSQATDNWSTTYSRNQHISFRRGSPPPSKTRINTTTTAGSGIDVEMHTVTDIEGKGFAD
jgi:hypothetical protein